MAGASWSAGLHDSARSGRKAADEIISVHSPEVMGSGDQTALVSWTPEIRADLEWWLDREHLVLGVALDQVSPQLDLWSDASDVGCGGTSGRRGCFQPVGSRGVRLLHKRQGAFGYRESSSLLRSTDKGFVLSDLCGQLDSHCLSSESGGNKISSSEFHSSAHLEVVGDSSGSFDSTIHHGPSQCVSGLVISSESGSRVRMDTQNRGVPRAPEEVASVYQSVCHLTKSPMFTIFFTVPRSERAGYRCSSPELGWVAGICLSTLVSDSSCPREAPVVLWGPTDHRSSLLASEDVVSGPSRLGGGRSGGSSSVQGPSSSTTLPSSSSESVRAVASCLETIQRFA